MSRSSIVRGLMFACALALATSSNAEPITLHAYELRPDGKWIERSTNLYFADCAALHPEPQSKSVNVNGIAPSVDHPNGAGQPHWLVDNPGQGQGVDGAVLCVHSTFDTTAREAPDGTRPPPFPHSLIGFDIPPTRRFEVHDVSGEPYSLGCYDFTCGPGPCGPCRPLGLPEAMMKAGRDLVAIDEGGCQIEPGGNLAAPWHQAAPPVAGLTYDCDDESAAEAADGGSAPLPTRERAAGATTTSTSTAPLRLFELQETSDGVFAYVERDQEIDASQCYVMAAYRWRIRVDRRSHAASASDRPHWILDDEDPPDGIFPCGNRSIRSNPAEESHNLIGFDIPPVTEP